MAKKSVVPYSFAAVVVAFAFSLVSSNTAVLAVPSAVSSSFEEGVRLYGQKQYKQALPVFMQFLRANPRSSAAYLYIANSYYALQQVGHAIDWSLGSVCETDEFKHAYLLDAASAQRLDASVSRDLAYYLQKSVAGQQECCGELFGIILGTEDDKSEKMKVAFPQTIKYLKAKLGV